MPSSPTLQDCADRENLEHAWHQVCANRGCPGPDGESLTNFEAHLDSRLTSIQSDLLSSAYQPAPLLMVPLRKPTGGIRLLGVPTVRDRVVLQSLAQTLIPVWEPTFSPFSFAYRPGKSAQEAVAAAQRFLGTGRSWVVDLDIEKSFDQVDHVRSVTHEALQQFRLKVRSLSRTQPGQKLEGIARRVGQFVAGWSTYYGFSQDRTLLAARSFARNCLRDLAWELWRTPQRRHQELLRLGVPASVADSAAFSLSLPGDRAPSGALAQAFPNAWFQRFGLDDSLPRVTSKRISPPSKHNPLQDFLQSPEFTRLRTNLTTALQGQTDGLASLEALIGHLARLTQGGCPLNSKPSAN